MFLRWLHWLFPTDAEKVATFCAGRSELSDEEFVAACDLPSDAETVRIALAVRRAVAAIGSVDPRFIQPDDAYPKPLIMLPFWDSIDWLAFVMELEKELETRFTMYDLDREDVFGPFPLSVRQMVIGIRRLLEERRSFRNSAC
jgi:hypothetical protein